MNVKCPALKKREISSRSFAEGAAGAAGEKYFAKSGNDPDTEERSTNSTSAPAPAPAPAPAEGTFGTLPTFSELEKSRTLAAGAENEEGAGAGGFGVAQGEEET